AFDDISAAGYTGVQFRSPEWDKFKDDPAASQAMLAARKLQCVSMSSGTVGLEQGKRDDYITRTVAHAKFLKKVGAPYIQVLDNAKPPVPQGAHQKLAALLTELGKRAADEGVKLGYHNHMNSLSELPDDAKRLYDAMDFKACGLIFDTAHC